MMPVTDPTERRVLLAMNDGQAPVPTLAQIAADTGVALWEVRKIVRAFHEHGLAEFGHLQLEDENLIAGRGYWLSRQGCAAK
jgi:transcription initiation factor IIE alpha subunit